MKTVYGALLVIVAFTELAFAEQPAVKLERDEQILQEISGQDIGHEKRIHGLVAVLEGSEQLASLQAAVDLRKEAFTSDVPYLAETLQKGGNPFRQMIIADVLGRLGDPRAADALRFEVEHGQPESKRRAIIALGRLKFDWPVPILAGQALHPSDKRNEYSILAASSLGRIGTVRAMNALETVIAESRQNVRDAATWAYEVAQQKVSPQRIDVDFPRGQKLTRYYKGLRYSFFQPALRTRAGTRPWLLVCIHDKSLNFSATLENCLPYAKKFEMALLVPHFDALNYPDYDTFNVLDDRADLKLLELVDHVGKYADVETRELYLHGLGTGGDFVQRFVMAYPDRVARAVARLKHFTFLDSELFFPEGVRVNPFFPDIRIEVRKFIKTDILFVTDKKGPPEGLRNKFIKQVELYGRAAGLRDRIAFRDGGAVHSEWEDEFTNFLFRSN